MQLLSHQAAVAQDVGLIVVGKGLGAFFSRCIVRYLGDLFGKVVIESDVSNYAHYNHANTRLRVCCMCSLKSGGMFAADQQVLGRCLQFHVSMHIC